MAEQSHREEMSAAIRAQRERQAVPRTLAGADEPAPVPEPAAEAPPAEEPEPESRPGFLARLLGG
ncbi:MAG TPA: hypothetical protein VMN82_07935 [Thermoanaerobaculia bacterium]|nr:hypothetical protein [Thermoanaerobaculia bacterium]